MHELQELACCAACHVESHTCTLGTLWVGAVVGRLVIVGSSKGEGVTNAQLGEVGKFSTITEQSLTRGDCVHVGDIATIESVM